ncbi:MAG: two-component system phosphate regulon sensor histidine kinase PhoR [Paracoccaceae bacterium]|jgi:two-component system phosphate regulon sensor histidine kinase PhoR
MKTTLSILNGISVPVVALNRDQIVVAANQRAKSAFIDLELGVPAEKAISKKRVFQLALVQALEDNVETTCILRIKQGFGHEYLTTIQPVDATQDTSALLIVTFQDQSPLKDAKTMRSEFVANVSHEIRSPLTAISGFIETLQGAARDDPAAQTHFLSLMAKESVRMTNLVADLLSLSQVEAKQRRAPKKNVDPNQIIAQALAAVAVLAKKRDKIIEVEINGTLPNLLGQHDDLVRLLINLLENGLNYSREHAVITLTAGVVGAQNPLGITALSILVHDQGDGIPAIDIPRLTERFYRVEKSRSRNVGGTGLGLAIVKHILVRHRGLMEIESTLGEGTTFCIYLPLENSEES